ncbi:MAG: hypothetical protein M1828_007044 [Chrysothrix sp. TS-e1954]|nr:MAG: hypothetical protein M1828_007044 [Chrysothrix sp. TS-e1954]
MAETPKIKLYTNHGCPYAQRVHIAMKELGIEPTEEIIIDLEKPREQWYLDINPRGLVPTLKYTTPTQNSGQEFTLIESAIVAQFLADLHPSHLLPSTTSDPFLRARIALFADTYATKVHSLMPKILTAPEASEREAKTAEFLATLQREIEPLLPEVGAPGKFFGGSESLTMAEVLTCTLFVRLYGAADDVLLPKSLARGLDELPRFSQWSRACREHESVKSTWDPEVAKKGLSRVVGKIRPGGLKA